MALGTTGIWTGDLSNPMAPAVLGTLDTSGTAYAVAMDAAGTTAYVADGTGGVKGISLADPRAPSLLGSALPSSIIYPDVTVIGNYAYLVHQNGSCDVADVSVPTAPHRIASRTLSGFGMRLGVNGTLGAVITETSTTDMMDIFDLTNPAAPVFLKTAT